MRKEKINEVLNSVMKEIRRSKMKYGVSHDSKLAIYMSEEFHYECMMQLNGALTTHVYEFFQRNTLYGLPVYVVMRNKENQHQHSLYRVVVLND